MGHELNAYRFPFGNLKERDYLINLVVVGRVILRIILTKFDYVLWSGFILFMIKADFGPL
jgi:hypothetical protein